MSKLNVASMERARDELITLTCVKERGWTDAMVRDLLGPPDKLATNPRYSSGHPVKLFAVDRVAAKELSDEFKQRKAKADARSARSVEVAERRKQETIDAAIQVEVHVARVSMDDLKKEAKAAYSARKPFSYPPDFTNKEFAERIMVNFIRHNLSDYDRQLRRLSGKIGRNRADNIVRLKVFQKMKVVYPELDNEIERQTRQRNLDQ